MVRVCCCVLSLGQSRRAHFSYTTSNSGSPAAGSASRSRRHPRLRCCWSLLLLLCIALRDEREAHPRRPIRSMSWFLFLATPGLSDALCGHTYTDAHGIIWSYNLSALSSDAGDYQASGINARYALNVCRPPLSACLVQPGTGSAVQFIGPKCTAPRCKQPCTLLGWGAIGGPTTRFRCLRTQNTPRLSSCSFCFTLKHPSLGSISHSPA